MERSRLMKPNFFIIGAPKCGTSSMWHYLRSHPAIFMTDPKEPFYWASAEYPPEKRRTSVPVKSFDEYMRLFAAVRPAHKIVGEASTCYLSSRTAVPDILRFNPAARFLVMLRNPADLVISWHRDRLFAFDEDRDLETAWALQEDRAAGSQLPSTCLLPHLLQYREIARLGAQMQKLFDRVPRSQVHIILFDDFKANPGREYRGLLQFLGVPDDGRRQFEAENEAKSHRFGRLGRILLSPPPALTPPMKMARRIARSLKLNRLGRSALMRAPVENRAEISEFRSILVDAFADEVALLEDLLKRDLSAWRRHKFA